MLQSSSYTPKLFDVVTSFDPAKYPFTSGHLRYNKAVVVSTDPLTLKSVEGDMTWYNRRSESLKLLYENDSLPESLLLSENPMMTVKQVTLVRTDLRNTYGEKVRTGKMFAQVQHAALKAYRVTNQRLLERWALNDSYKKVALKVSSEQELLEYHDILKAKGFMVALILDNGLTEFKEPTYTCLSVIGISDQLDKITGKLSLY